MNSCIYIGEKFSGKKIKGSRFGLKIPENGWHPNSKFL
jgi:hypothetical protein